MMPQETSKAAEPVPGSAAEDAARTVDDPLATENVSQDPLSVMMTRVTEAETRLAEAEAEQAKLKDQALRALAEAENTRRRAQREIEERERFALSSFARELTSVVDNLRRAVETVAPDARAADAKLNQFAEGVELTEREFMAILERNGIKRVAPSGLPFDHNLHQAIAQTETREHAPGTVMQVVQAGYTLHGRILRPALVVVAKAPADDSPPGSTVDKTV